MGHARMHAHVEVPIERVFDYAFDSSHWAEWNVELVEVKADVPLARVGDRFSGKTKFLGRVSDFEGEVASVERPQAFALSSRAVDGSGRESWTVRLTPSGTGTDIDSEIDYEFKMPIVGAIADKLFVERQAQRMMDQSRDNFVALVEQHVRQPA